MSEEIRNPSIVVPKAITISVLVNGALGFAMTIALVFSSVDHEKVAEYSEMYGFPFIGTFQLVFKSNAATIGLGALVVVLGFSSTLAAFATSSRTNWSFARDMGLPYSDYIARVCFSSPFCLSMIFAGTETYLTSHRSHQIHSCLYVPFQSRS